ncbi:MAG: hypothetical protein IIB05_09600 [Bacteroidetes bacterium]|nr:hypothetical protein [Bacteroidota bacterium]
MNLKTINLKDVLNKFFGALCIVAIVTFSACKKDEPDPVPTVKEYIGSAECATCHAETYASFMKTGHPYKLNEVDGAAPAYPYSSVPEVPTGYSWSDISYVIGGYNRKARFVDQDGYIITGDDVQYNLANQGWVGYHSDEAPGTKPYDCGKCHTTGWKHIDDGGTPQNGMEGMYGQFSEGGIHCEACNGEGNIHAVTESASDINVDTSSELCGSCHYRNEDHSIGIKICN